MKIRMTSTAAGPTTAFHEGQVYEFEDDDVQALAFLEAGAAIEVGDIEEVTDVGDLQRRVADADARGDAAQTGLRALKQQVADASDLAELQAAVAGVPVEAEPVEVDDEAAEKQPRKRGGRKPAE